MFLPSSETEGAAAPAAVLPPAELLAHEEDAEVHQEDAAGDRQVSQTCCSGSTAHPHHLCRRVKSKRQR